MPYKKGPYGTLRYYNGSTGRYENNPMLLTNSIKKKKSYQQKEQERKDEIEYLARKSSDKNLYEVYKMLEKINPGTTRHVNYKYFDKISGKEREFDIITTKAIYEIKSGSRGRHVKQFLSQIEIAKRIGKDHVVYSPGISNYQVKHLRKMGINVYNNFAQLEEMEKKRK